VALAANQWVSLGTRCYLLTMVHVVWRWEHHKSSGGFNVLPTKYPCKIPLTPIHWQMGTGAKMIGTSIWMLWYWWPNLLHQFNSGQKNMWLMWFGEAYPWIQNLVFVFFPIESPLAFLFLPAGCHGGVSSMPFWSPIKLPVLMWKTWRSSMIRPMINHARWI